jgi:2-oxoacid:acceptor oxidoreductase gamma subunit (pyruvate/2-ketoisovalerate family)/2-oxoacid:acceptor oxidoreductase delta subunit (pyruvate/2-ketoisovalerate family)
MIEIRFHGRGGQGAVLASEMLAQAAFLDGKVPQSFPFFGVERRGAPVTAYARIDDRPMSVRTSITHPDIVVVLDPGLLRSTPVADGLRPGGLVLVNSRRPPTEIDAPPGARRATVDASRIALAHGLGSATMPVVNTVILGALAHASGVVSLDSVATAIEKYAPAKPRQNRDAAVEGYGAVRMIDATSPPVPPKPRVPQPLPPLPEGPVASMPTTVLHTSSWRTLTPRIHLEHCTKCNFCWKFCPDDAIGFDEKGFPVIRMDYCKGCGICAEECPPKTIEMVAEE